MTHHGQSRQATDQELIDWAEHDMVLAEHSPTALRGAAAAAAGRAMMENALGGPGELDRALGGRPPLDPGAPAGQHARKRQVRLPADLDAALEARATVEGRTRSEVLRSALSDYLAANPAS